MRRTTKLLAPTIDVFANGHEIKISVGKFVARFPRCACERTPCKRGFRRADTGSLVGACPNDQRNSSLAARRHRETHCHGAFGSLHPEQVTTFVAEVERTFVTPPADLERILRSPRGGFGALPRRVYG